MNKKNKTHWVYWKHEMKRMNLFQKYKWIALSPLVKLCETTGITPNWLTFFWWIICVIWLVLSVHFSNPIWFICSIWAQLFIDWLDWTVARELNMTSEEWTFLDIIMDHVWITTSSLFILYFSTISPQLVLLYTVFYTIVIACWLILWKINNPYWLVLRPRLFVYIIITFTLGAVLEYTLILFTVILFIHSITGLQKLYNYFKIN